MNFAINHPLAQSQIIKSLPTYSTKGVSSLERCPKQDIFINSNSKNVAFGHKLTPLKDLLKTYSDGGIKRIGTSIYSEQSLSEIQQIAEKIGIKKAIRILGHGLESIAFEIPNTSKGSGVLKISKVALPDFILNICTPQKVSSRAKLVNDELAKYIVPTREYQVHKLDNRHVWYSYIQDIAPNSTTKDGKKVSLLTNDMCNKFAQQVRNETAYVINENMAKQYGIITLPNGKKEIRAVDLGIFEPKLGHESDEWFDMDEILKEIKQNKEKRLRSQIPDARIYTGNIK